METASADKISRVLGIYTKLINGGIVYKAEEANDYGVNERSIQRDIDDIRNFMDQSVADTGVVNSVIYDRNCKGYRLEKIYHLKFSNSEILAICKILLDSRAFTKREMQSMLEKLIDCCVPEENQKLVKELIANEQYHYIEPRHHSIFIDRMWEIGEAIHDHHYMEITYQKLKDHSLVTRKVRPMAIMFSEMYFYMAAIIENAETREALGIPEGAFPTIYRIDRIQDFRILKERFYMPYTDRFEEGEFRKRIQFMYGGKLRRIEFLYSGLSIEAVLDRLPTAQVIAEKDGVYTVRAEVFGNGIDMWLRSQGDLVRVLKN